MKTLIDPVTLKKLISDTVNEKGKGTKECVERRRTNTRNEQGRWAPGMRGRRFTKYAFINLESQHLVMKSNMG